jgi:hypothetical protein
MADVHEGERPASRRRPLDVLSLRQIHHEDVRREVIWWDYLLQGVDAGCNWGRERRVNRRGFVVNHHLFLLRFPRVRCGGEH